MCDFCKVYENGDIDYKEIVNAKNEKGMSVAVGVNANYKTMCADLFFREETLSLIGPLEHSEAAISYCPMCGRKL